MNIQDVLRENNVLQTLANQYNTDEKTTASIFDELLPEVSKGLKNNIRHDEGLGSFEKALERGNHQYYLEHPETLTDQRTIQEGNGILSHIFNDKTHSRHVANKVANKTHTDSSLVKKLLPIVATLAMGALSKKVSRSNSASLSGGKSGFDLTSLLSVLDTNQNGTIIDEVMGIAKKFLGGK